MTSIDLKEYENLCYLGSGSFGEVRKVRHKSTKKIYVAKISHRMQKYDPDQHKWREVTIMPTLNHPSILKYYGFSGTDFSNEDKPVLILEYAHNKSLNDQFTNPTPLFREHFTPTKRLICFYGVASGMNYLHSQNILHRDLKLDNILLNYAFFPKISDFGLSKKLHTHFESFSNSSSGLKGSLLYMSPEALSKCDFTFKNDVYAFGMVLYTLLTNKRPYQEQKENPIALKLAGRKPDLDEGSVPQVYYDLIQRCLSQEPEKRPSFEEIVQEFITNPAFITDDVNRDEFLEYVNYINAYFNTSNPEEQAQITENFYQKYEYLKTDDDTNTANNTNCQESEEQSSKDNQSLSSDLKLLNPLVEVGNPEAMYYSGYQLLQSGQNVEAFNYFQMASELGHAYSQFLAGTMLLQGDYGIPQNTKEGVRLIKLAADNGHIEAMTQYATMLHKGSNGVSKNVSNAVHYLTKASDAGDPNAMYYYAQMLENGDEVDVDKTEACRYYKLAADYQFVPAMIRYGKIVTEDELVDFDIFEALKYFEKASRSGNKEAQQLYNEWYNVLYH